MEASELPEERIGLGFPQTFRIETHPNVYNAVKWKLRTYLQTTFNDHRYGQVILELKDEIRPTRSVLWKDGDYTGYRIVNENGHLPGGIDTTLM